MILISNPSVRVRELSELSEQEKNKAKSKLLFFKLHSVGIPPHLSFVSCLTGAIRKTTGNRDWVEKVKHEVHACVC